MFDLGAEYLDPIVLALLPHREARASEIRIVEHSKRDGDQPVELALDLIMDGPSRNRGRSER